LPRRTNETAVSVCTESGAYLLFSGKPGKWKKMGPVLRKENVNSMTFDMKHGRIYAATHSEGVFVSEDLGGKWRAANRGLHVRKVWTIETDPTSQGTLYAGTQYGHLFRSGNGGESWEEVVGLFDAPGRGEWGIDWGFGTTGLCIHTIRVDPADSRRIFIVPSGRGPYRSDDSGATWKRLLNGVTDWCPVGGDARAPSIPKNTPDPRMAEHLNQVHTCTHKLEISKTEPSLVFQQNHCGVFASRDAGDHWEDISGKPKVRHGFPLVMVENGGRSVFTVPAYQGPENGGCRKHNSCVRGQLAVLRTHDDGKTWKKLMKGLPAAVHTCVLRDAMASGPRGLYFGTTTGEVYASEDGGESWDQILNGVGRIQGVSAGNLP
jgi:photosystem II stability/assembly factor-like uncharacterized protein